MIPNQHLVSPITITATTDGDPSRPNQLQPILNKYSLIIETTNISHSATRTTITWTLATSSPKPSETLLSEITNLTGVYEADYFDATFKLHEHGKITTECNPPLTAPEQLALAYTPGVARICEAIAQKPELARRYTIKNNTVAIVTDGSAVLGLGNIGPLAALPVMEGKAMLLKHFAQLNAIPICLDTQDPKKIIDTVTHLSPTFGAINLEDIAAPQCFEIENELRQRLNIPVFHDDQHGTAIVCTAGILNATRLLNKSLSQLKIVILGVGAAGSACKDMLLQLGVKNIIGCDRKGAISRNRSDLNSAKRFFAETTNPDNLTGSLSDIIIGADIFIGVSAPKSLSVEQIKSMNQDPIVFAMANPIPEIMPAEALPHVGVMATGRSDFPNQINNVLAFPGIFKGSLRCGATDINDAMKLASAYAIANCVSDNELSPTHIVPSVFDPEVVKRVAAAVEKAAYDTGVAQQPPLNYEKTPQQKEEKT